jgi:Flp pilus assembly protein TadD
LTVLTNVIEMRSAKTLMLLALAASFAASTPGCAGKNKNSKSAQSKATMAASKEASDASEDAFARGANRPPTPKTLFALAQIMESQGKDDQAEPVLRRIIADEPKFMPAYVDLAELRMRQRQIEEAYNTLTAGLKIQPNEPILLNNRGMCQVLLKDYEGALANFTRATSLRPDDARYRSNMAMTLALMGRYDESYSLYTLVMSPKDARENLAVLAEANGDPNRAEDFRHGKKSIAKAPTPAPAPMAIVAPVVPVAPATQPAVAIIAAPATQPILAMEIISEAADGEMNSESIASTPMPIKAKPEVIKATPATQPAVVTIAAPATQPIDFEEAIEDPT